MSSRSIFLVGAPTFSTLQWEENGLLSEPVPPFQDPGIHHETPQMLHEDDTVKWRLLPGSIISETPRSKCPAGIAARAQFLTTHDLATSFGRQEPTRDDTEISQFYDHSFTVHETSEISAQYAPLGGSTLDSNPGTESTGTSFATNEDGEVSTARPHIQGGITNLQDIPNSAYLNSIVPQTMTVNLIAIIIAVRPPRRIVTRQWKRELDLVEAVVGDETRTGFGVTFWLPPLDDRTSTRKSGNAAGDELRRSLMQLRPRDIVLLRTVGLSCFRERVYGQSLRQGLTKIDLLHRQQIDATDTSGIYQLRDILNHAAKNDDLPLLKVRKVHEWIRRFVPVSAGGNSTTPAGKTVTLPPDSQDATYN